jgi:hypothetical protein
MHSPSTQPDWPQVLAEWSVIRALDEKAGWPNPLRESPAVKAAFVAEAASYVRVRALDWREAEAEARALSASDAVYEQHLGAGYWLIESGTSEFQAGDGPFAHGSGPCCQCTATDHNSNVCLCEAELHHDSRLDVALEAWQAGRLAAVEYWCQVAACRVPEGFFAEAPADGAIAIMRARFDLWWALFVRSLRTVLGEANPSYARMLQALPRLRADARRPNQKYVLTALVQEWREANAERYGLLKDIHFPVLQRRADAKLRCVNAWFERHAAGFKHDTAVRDTAAQALSQILAVAQSPDLPAYGNN